MAKSKKIIHQWTLTSQRHPENGKRIQIASDDKIGLGVYDVWVDPDTKIAHIKASHGTYPLCAKYWRYV